MNSGLQRSGLKCLVLFGTVVIGLLGFSLGPPPRHSGVPGEFSCTACHAGTPLANSPAIDLILPAGKSYRPGVKQRISLIVTDAAAQIYGFQLTARDGANNEAGVFAPIDDATEISTYVPDDLHYIQHSMPRSDGTFTFDWTAPASDAGPVTFYMAANAANGNGSPTGDRIHLRTVVLRSERCDLDLTYSGGTLNIAFQLRTPVPATWNVWMSLGSTTFPLWSIPLGVINPEVPVPLSFPLAPLGEIGLLTTLTRSGAIVCSDWETVNTGAPAARTLSAEDLENIRSQVGTQLGRGRGQP